MVTRREGADAERLRRLVQRLFRRFGALARDATPCGIPLSIGHAHALMLLLGQDDLPQQDLGRLLCIDKSNVARLCARMEGAGHVRQRRSERDGRSRRIALTARGRRLAREVDLASAQRFAQLLAGLAPRKRSAVLDALDHLLAAVESLPQPEAE